MRSMLLTILVLLNCESVQARSAIAEPLASPPLLSQDGRKAEAPEEAQGLEEESTPVDPYAGWRSWCEPQQYRPCKTRKDCAGINHPANKPLKCVRPYWARDPGDRVCSPGYSNRSERAHQRARLRELVRIQYSGEFECSPGAGRCGHRKVRGDRLAALLNMVAQRETTMRPWKRHRLNGDIAYARKAWERTAKIYGHARNDDRVVFVRGGNRHYPHRARWSFGLGLYGMNASLFTRTWDPAAPPEVLCREVEATEAYLRSTRKAWRKLSGGINCDGKPGREWHGIKGRPTWYDVHRYASGGQLCPSKKREGFERRARQAGLDPYAVVTLSDLGTPIPRDGQNDVAILRASELDAFSTRWLFSRAL